MNIKADKLKKGGIDKLSTKMAIVITLISAIILTVLTATAVVSGRSIAWGFKRKKFACR